MLQKWFISQMQSIYLLDFNANRMYKDYNLNYKIIIVFDRVTGVLDGIFISAQM